MRNVSATEPTPGSARAKLLRVMVVDDQSAVLDVVVDSVRYAGFEVVATAQDGAQAVAVAARERPDAVLMDIAMPKMNGVDAMREMLATGSVRRVALMSGEYRSLGLTREDLTAAGAAAFLEKPFSVTDLFTLLDRWEAELARK